MATEAQRRAIKKYHQKVSAYTRTFLLRIDRRKYPKVAAALDAKENKTEYLIKLIREDIGA